MEDDLYTSVESVEVESVEVERCREVESLLKNEDKQGLVHKCT